eukprot:352283_1
MGAKLSDLYKICTCGKATDTFDPNISQIAPSRKPSQPHIFHIKHASSITSLDEKTIELLMNMDVAQISPQNSMRSNHSNPTMRSIPESDPCTPITPIPNNHVPVVPYDEHAMIIHSNPRLAQITKMSVLTDRNTLRQKIESNYKIEEHTPIVTVSEHELKPMKGQVYRKGNTPPDADLDRLLYDMNAQLVSLMTRDSSDRSITKQTIVITDVHEHQQTEESTPTPSTNLLRDGSEDKWDTPRLQNECTD